MDQEHELCKCGIIELERAYVVVQDLDVFKLSYTFRSQNHRASAFKSTSYQYPHYGMHKHQHTRWTLKIKALKVMLRARTLKETSPHLVLIKCYNCQGYGHVVANCPSPFKTAITDKVFIEISNPDSITSSKATPVSKEFSVVSPATTAIVPSSAAPTIVCPSPSLALMPSLPTLLLTAIVVTYLPPLLPTPSPIPLWLVLGPKSKFFTVIQHTTD